MKSGDLAVRDDANTGYAPIDATLTELVALRALRAAVEVAEHDLTGGVIGDMAEAIERALALLRKPNEPVRAFGGISWIQGVELCWAAEVGAPVTRRIAMVGHVQSEGLDK